MQKEIKAVIKEILQAHKEKVSSECIDALAKTLSELVMKTFDGFLKGVLNVKAKKRNKIK